MNPEDLKYHKEHTWARIKGNKATVGITDYAQRALGDIVYIDLPEVGANIEIDSEFSEIESTKATSSVIAPVTGTITEVNDELSDMPEVINEDPYGKGWIAVVEITGDGGAADLLDSADYTRYEEDEA